MLHLVAEAVLTLSRIHLLDKLVQMFHELSPHLQTRMLSSELSHEEVKGLEFIRTLGIFRNFTEIFRNMELSCKGIFSSRGLLECARNSREETFSSETFLEGRGSSEMIGEEMFQLERTMNKDKVDVRNSSQGLLVIDELYSEDIFNQEMMNSFDGKHTIDTREVCKISCLLEKTCVLAELSPRRSQNGGRWQKDLIILNEKFVNS